MASLAENSHFVLYAADLNQQVSPSSPSLLDFPIAPVQNCLKHSKLRINTKMCLNGRRMIIF